MTAVPTITAVHAVPTAAAVGDPADTAKVLDAMRSITTEAELWTLAEALVVLYPERGDFARLIDLASSEGVVGNFRPQTLRLYRDTAKRWPADKRVANVSFSAHREAANLGNIGEASKVLTDLASTLGAGKVTVSAVRRAVQAKQGKIPAAPAAKPPKAAPGPNPYAVVMDLVDKGGALLIAQIDASQPDLDKLHAGLGRVIAYVEALRARNARKAAKPAPAKKAAVSKPTAAPTPAAATGDLRGL